MWAVGTFTSIGAPGQATVTRNHIVAFDMTSDTILPVDPNVNGEVTSITFSADCAAAYIGGKFSSVGPTVVRDIAKISTSTGAVDTGFAHSAGAEVYAVLMTSGGHLLVGGAFKTISGSSGSTASYLTSLNPSTGRVDGYLSVSISGTLPNASTHIFHMFPNPAGNRVAMSGVFTSVGGVARRQAFVLDLGASSATLDAWYAPVLNEACAPTSEQFYAHALAWSPDGAYLYIASTGFRGATLCDSVAKFSSAASPTEAPMWVNKTGGDSLYSVAATATDVYVAGHERWLDNPLGLNSCGTGCVSRPGIGAVDATTGLATAWNPTRARGHGAQDLYLDSAGDLWVSSDDPIGSTACGGRYHPGICEFPHP
jgi:hypothetical protein